MTKPVRIISRSGYRSCAVVDDRHLAALLRQYQRYFISQVSKRWTASTSCSRPSRTGPSSPRCRGNERIRVDAQGGVFHQVNDRDCDSAAGWSAPYGAPRSTLSADERAKLASVIQTSGVLDLPPETADGARSDGRREELEIDIAGRHVVVAVDRTKVPAFSQVRQALIDLAAR